MVLEIVSTPTGLVRLGRTAGSDKDLEILLLRQRLAIIERKQRQPVRLSRSERLMLVVLAIRGHLKSQAAD